MVNTTKPLQDQEIQSRDRILPNTGILVFFGMELFGIRNFQDSERHKCLEDPVPVLQDPCLAARGSLDAVSARV